MTLNDLMTSNLLVLLQKVGTVMTLSVLTLTPPRMKKVLEGYSAMKERFANVRTWWYFPTVWCYLYFCHKMNEFIAGGGGGNAYLWAALHIFIGF